MNFFENYAIVAMESDNVTFYACKIIKDTSDFNSLSSNLVVWCPKIGPRSKKVLKTIKKPSFLTVF